MKAAKTTAAQGRNVAERTALVYVGATLEARDRVLGLAGELANRFGSRAAAERELGKDIRRFERRGTTARNQLERDVKKARTRLERELRTRRRDAERVVKRNASTPRRIASPRSCSSSFPRRRGGAAVRASLPASYLAGGIRRPHTSPADVAPSPPSTVDPPSWRVVGL